MARDRYLWNSGEDNIHDPSLEKTVTTSRQKRENFWFYHKWHVIVCICCAVLVGVFIFDMLNKEEPDYEIAILSQSFYMEEDLNKIQTAIESVAEDRNGDGKVSVIFNQYTISGTGKGDLEMSSMAKLMNDLSTTQSVIYIVDDNNLTTYQSEHPGLFTYADGTTPQEGATDFDRIGIKWKDCPFLSSIELKSDITQENGETQTADSQKIFQDLRVCIRSQNFNPEENPELMKKYEDNVALYQKITNNG